MNTIQLQDALSLLRIPACGVYPADAIPKKWTKPTGMIVNMDNHDDPGSHWVAIFVNGQGNGVYFDSYGLPPSNAHHLQSLRRNTKSFVWNTHQLQSLTSKVCGQYCIMFLDCMSRGLSLRAFCKQFTNDHVKNDYRADLHYKRVRTRGRSLAFKKRKTKNHIGGGIGNRWNRKNICIQSCVPRI